VIASLREPWWRSVLFGLVLTLIFLATGVWQLTVVSAAVVGFLAGGGRKGAIRGIQATAPAWFLWLLVLSAIAPVEETLILLGSILGAGWGLVVVGLETVRRGRRRRFGLLLAAAGIAWFLPEWSNPAIGVPVAFNIGLEFRLL